MTLTAHDVGAVLSLRRPGMTASKLHRLLYYCQGHHLATFDAPLFEGEIAAWPDGPAVPVLHGREIFSGDTYSGPDMGEAQLNTIGYVLHRYGNLTSVDLTALSCAEMPWQNATAGLPRIGANAIRPEWMRDYFRGPGAVDRDLLPVDAEAVKEWLRGAGERRDVPGRCDDVTELKERLRRRGA